MQVVNADRIIYNLYSGLISLEQVSLTGYCIVCKLSCLFDSFKIFMLGYCIVSKLSCLFDSFKICHAFLMVLKGILFFFVSVSLSFLFCSLWNGDSFRLLHYSWPVQVH